jgi:hypothetical protein
MDRIRRAASRSTLLTPETRGRLAAEVDELLDGVEQFEPRMAIRRR